MKTTWTLISLLISSAAFAVSTNATTMDSETADSSTVHYGTNTNDRYNNLDTRSNSQSSPAQYGAERNTLGEPENLSRTTGGSTADPDTSTLDWDREAGNPTTEWERSQSGAPSNVNRATGGSTMDQDRYPSGRMQKPMHQPDSTRSTGGSSETNMGAAPGAAAGAAAGTGVTAQETGRTTADAEMVRKIRAEITSNTDLSTRAHNVKVINQNGQIYLKGPVANMMEKSKVEEIAKRMAGNTAVVNQTYVEKK